MLPNKFIAKIEGHGALHIDWDKNKVELKVLEGERLFGGGELASFWRRAGGVIGWVPGKYRTPLLMKAVFIGP